MFLQAVSMYLVEIYTCILHTFASLDCPENAFTQISVQVFLRNQHVEECGLVMTFTSTCNCAITLSMFLYFNKPVLGLMTLKVPVIYLRIHILYPSGDFCHTQ